MPSDQKEFFALLNRHINPKDYELFACGKDAPTSQAVEQFGNEFSVALPDDFVRFSTSSLGGLYVAVKEELWPRPKEFAVGPFWTFLFGLWVYGFAKDIPPFMDIRVQTRAIRDQLGNELTPCLKIVGDADVYCFDRTGVLCRLDHETQQHQATGKSFLETLEFELSQLAARKAKRAAMNDEQKPG